MLTPDQWKFILAPGTTPASEEALEWFTSGARTEHYEFAATAVMEEWPVLDREPEVQAASWSSEASTYSPSDADIKEVSQQLREALLRGDDQPGGESLAV